jgi:anaerobic magnesium-protoporphyrin IX monomethyl ester cyclase
MRVLIVNPPYHAITTSYGVGAQVPLGLLLAASALVREGHEVRLLDGEARNLSIEEIAGTAAAFSPALVMTGHAGSTAAHPIVLKMARALKARLPSALIVYGCVFPTYHAGQILREEPSVGIIVRGEGERTIARLAGSLVRGTSLETVPGIAFRDGTAVKLTAPAEMIDDLDAYPAAWQLIEDWDLYRCWGLGRAAIVQFSRGCPHLCTYCGQRGFWTKWRYRDPEKVAAEIAWLHRAKGVNFVDLADENPTSSKRLWKSLLEAVIAQQLPVKLFATIRATDVVRDADILHLYKKAGIDCVLMGIETTNPGTLQLIRKGSTTRDDLEAIRLLRCHGILSMAGHIVGFEVERFRDYWNALRQLLYYNPDLLNAMYVTPHRWTPFYGENQSRAVIEGDQAKWDYRHQVLGTRHLRPWQIFLMVKATELAVHVRPRALWRLLFYKDRSQRRAYRWCFRNAGLVWLAEIFEFLFRSSRLKEERALEDHAGAQLSFEAPLTSSLPVRRPAE